AARPHLRPQGRALRGARARDPRATGALEPWARATRGAGRHHLPPRGHPQPQRRRGTCRGAEARRRDEPVAEVACSQAAQAAQDTLVETSGVPRFAAPALPAAAWRSADPPNAPLSPALSTRDEVSGRSPSRDAAYRLPARSRSARRRVVPDRSG